MIEAARRGTSYGAATAAEVELAEEVVARIPSVEMLRMTSSGTEAAMSAVRLARAATGREVIVKFAGAYHGHSDGLLAEAGSGLATPRHTGEPRGHRRRRPPRPWSSPWNDRERGRPGRSPSTRSPLCSPSRSPPTWASSRPPQGFLEFLREASREAGALLVFDEVITGFRVARGGAQELYGIEPDLTVLGKILGGGLPAAAFARPAGSDGTARSGRRRLPGGDAVGKSRSPSPPGLRRCAALDAAAYGRLAAAHRPARRRPRRGDRRAGRSRSPRSPGC